MKPWLVAVCLGAALPSAAESADPVVVLQETRAPVVSKRKHSAQPAVQHVVLLKNVSPYPVRRLRVTVEFYDFFGKLLLVRSGMPVPSSLGPGDTATLSLPTPALEAMRRTRYRFEYGGGPPRSGRSRPRRGKRDSAGRAVPSPLGPAPA